MAAVAACFCLVVAGRVFARFVEPCRAGGVYGGGFVFTRWFGLAAGCVGPPRFFRVAGLCVGGGAVSKTAHALGGRCLFSQPLCQRAVYRAGADVQRHGGLPFSRPPSGPQRGADFNRLRRPDYHGALSQRPVGGVCRVGHVFIRFRAGADAGDYGLAAAGRRLGAVVGVSRVSAAGGADGDGGRLAGQRAMAFQALLYCAGGRVGGGTAADAGVSVCALPHRCRRFPALGAAPSFRRLRRYAYFSDGLFRRLLPEKPALVCFSRLGAGDLDCHAGEAGAVALGCAGAGLDWRCRAAVVVQPRAVSR